jgi:hypothetical protein
VAAAAALVAMRAPPAAALVLQLSNSSFSALQLQQNKTVRGREPQPRAAQGAPATAGSGRAVCLAVVSVMLVC